MCIAFSRGARANRWLLPLSPIWRRGSHPTVCDSRFARCALEMQPKSGWRLLTDQTHSSSPVCPESKKDHRGGRPTGAESRSIRSRMGTRTYGSSTPTAVHRTNSHRIPAIRMSRTGLGMAAGSTSPPITGLALTFGACSLLVVRRSKSPTVAVGNSRASRETGRASYTSRRTRTRRFLCCHSAAVPHGSSSGASSRRPLPPVRRASITWRVIRARIRPFMSSIPRRAETGFSDGWSSTKTTEMFCRSVSRCRPTACRSCI